MFRLFIPVFILLIPANMFCYSQTFSRVHLDFTVKVKEYGGGQSLTMGQVYYDRNIKQIIYYLDFPEKETWVSADTVLYRVRDGKLISRTFSPSLSEFSVFHMVLSSNLQNFGLGQTQYKPETPIREGNQVITTWKPPLSGKDQLGKIMVSVSGKQLSGVIFFDPQENILRKQFFEGYLKISGLAFPGKIIEINMNNGLESYQITTFRNITIDEPQNDSKYNYPVSNLH